jgi:hypothetical protein
MQKPRVGRQQTMRGKYSAKLFQRERGNHLGLSVALTRQKRRRSRMAQGGRPFFMIVQ